MQQVPNGKSSKFLFVIIQGVKHETNPKCYVLVKIKTSLLPSFERKGNVFVWKIERRCLIIEIELKFKKIDFTRKNGLLIVWKAAGKLLIVHEIAGAQVTKLFLL